jgi:hypothetical protein
MNTPQEDTLDITMVPKHTKLAKGDISHHYKWTPFGAECMSQTIKVFDKLFMSQCAAQRLQQRVKRKTTMKTEKRPSVYVCMNENSGTSGTQVKRICYKQTPQGDVEMSNAANTNAIANAANNGNECGQGSQGPNNGAGGNGGARRKSRKPHK